MSKAIKRQLVDWSALKGRSVIITGGASGLGEATARKFAEHGAYVTITDLAEQRGKELAGELSSEGRHAIFVKCDTTNWESSAAAFKQAVNHSPSKTLDVAILFAGVSGPVRSFVDRVLESREPTLDDDAEPQSPPEPIEVNLQGTWNSVWLALHYFRLRGAEKSETRKSLCIVTSLAAYIDQPYAPEYSASKYGARGFFRALRPEVHKVNARVNNIAPGFILTPLTMRNHGITSPDQPSKLLGSVLPWAPIEHAVEAAGRCAIDDVVDGRTLAIFPDGFVDIEEDMDAEHVDKVTRLLKTELFDRIAAINHGRAL